MAEAVPSARARSRRRRANTSAGPRNIPHKVMVNAEDREVRINRLTLLAKLRELFLQVADISILQ